MRSPLMLALVCSGIPLVFCAADLSGQRTAAPAASPKSAKELTGASFGDAFERWRLGDESAFARVRVAADELCRNMNRCDVPRIVEHYAALTPQQRLAGIQLEQRVLELRATLSNAHSRGMMGSEWTELSAQVEVELQGLWEESRTLADLGARGKVVSLRSEYQIALLEKMRGLQWSSEERASLAEAVERDARDALADYAAFAILRSALIPRLSLARIDYLFGRLAAAQAGFEALARSATELGDDENAVNAYEGLLAIAKDRGDEIEIDACLRALASRRAASEYWPLASAWAMRLMHRDRADEALAFLDGFKLPDPDSTLPEAQKTRRDFAYTRAEALLRLRRLDQAREAAATARQLQGTTAERVLIESREQDFLEARIELAAGNPQAAIALMAEPSQLAQFTPREEGAARTLLGEARLALGDARGARLELERTLELAEAERQRALIGPLLSTDDVRRFNFIGEWEGAGLETVALLTRAYLDLEDPLAAALACEDWQSRSLRGDDDELAVLRARSGNPLPHEALTAAQLQAWAATTELGLVTWIFGADSGAVVHVRIGDDGKLDCAGVKIDLGRESLREAVRRLRDGTLSGSNTSKLAEEIRNALFPAAIREHIGVPRSKDDRLLLLVHGPVEALPIELLGLGSGTFDSELCLLALPGLPSGEPGPRVQSEGFDHWRMLGSPVDGADSDGRALDLLPGARDELHALAKLHPDASATQGPDLKRAAVERALLSGDCLHIATHLEIKRGESRSRFPAAGLRLDDGDVISARDIANLTPRSPLVVLSACETGGGHYADGEGLFGVARAFLEGGTRNLVVTLWPVADKAAGEFSVAFHRALKAGAAPSQAARLARLELIAGHYPAAEWAAFRFLGRD